MEDSQAAAHHLASKLPGWQNPGVKHRRRQNKGKEGDATYPDYEREQKQEPDNWHKKEVPQNCFYSSRLGSKPSFLGDQWQRSASGPSPNYTTLVPCA